MFDILGDIHGHANELIKLLELLGYKRHNGIYCHKSRKAVFVGDIIDRGPQVRETLEIVKPMVDNQQAIVVLGNHEYNLICYRSQINGNYLREHNEKNNKQHAETIKQFSNTINDLNDYVEWFKTIPLIYEHNGIRIAHASWVQPIVDKMKAILPDCKMNTNFLVRSTNDSLPEFEIVETLLKGIEVELPEGISFSDKDKTSRSALRIKWWVNTTNKTYYELALNNISHIPHIQLPNNIKTFARQYPEEEKPVFFGHYWLNGKPSVQAANVCCLDYSVAANGKLVAYRWEGEKKLDNRKLIYVNKTLQL